MKLRSDNRAAVIRKIAYSTNQENQLKSLFLQNNTGDSIPLQAHRDGTSLNGIENELIRFFGIDENSLLQLVSSMAIHCNRREV